MAVTRNGILLLVGIGGLLLVSAASVALHPSPSPLTSGIRIAGLAGLALLAAGMILTAWPREIYRSFGASFVSVHHLFALSGLVLITLHPVLLSIRLMNLSVLLPRFGSIQIILNNGGRPALLLLYIAIAGLLLRRYTPRYWRLFHGLAWVALLLGLVHGILIGTDMNNPVVMIPFSVLAGVAAGSFFMKRVRGSRESSG